MGGILIVAGPFERGSTVCDNKDSRSPCLSQANYPHADVAWIFATKQPMMNRIGPLGKRAGRLAAMSLAKRLHERVCSSVCPSEGKSITQYAKLHEIGQIIYFCACPCPPAHRSCI